MADSAPKPRFIVDESGKRSAVILKIPGYERLLAAWEEAADANDFAAARASAKTFLSPSELRNMGQRA